MSAPEPAFEKTPRQREAIDVLNRHRHAMLYGGSRSGKSVAIVRAVFLRAYARASTHVMTRFRYNHARTSLGHQTVPFVLKTCFPGAEFHYNRTESYWTLPAADGGESTVWLAGTDDQKRVEKVLGKEYSTIFFNECSEIPFDAVLMFHTRLAENAGLTRHAWYDCNPPGTKHWTNLFFREGLLPDKEQHGHDVGHLQMNPIHNVANLPEEYIAELERMPLRYRKRFLEGEFMPDVEGALWTYEMVNVAKLLADEYAGPQRVVVGVDPSVSDTKDSDECGIGVASIHGHGLEATGAVHADLSGKYSTRRWAQRVVEAYYAYGANEVVAEVNNGGDLVEDAIRNLDPNVRVVKVHAANSKKARAEPVSMLYEQRRIAHLGDFPDLEAEMTEWIPDQSTRSPNRVDWLTWAFTHLMVRKKGDFKFTAV